MTQEVINILSSEVQEVIKSPELSLSLLRCTSILYLNGAAPRVCEKAQKEYYNKLKIDGMARAEVQEKADKRTCIPAWNGLKYISKACTHVSSKLIYDQQAISFLNQGFLTEKDFVKLPDRYIQIPTVSDEKKTKKKTTRKNK